MKSKTNISIVSNTGVRRKSEVIIGDSGTYTSGDILDANATQELINSGGGTGGDAMSIVIVDAKPEDNKFNLEAGKLYNLGFNLKDTEFLLPALQSTEYVEHIIIYGYISTTLYPDVGFIAHDCGVDIQQSDIYSQSGNYRIDCMFVGNKWVVTYVLVIPITD